MTLSEIHRRYLQQLSTLYSQNEAAQITSIAFDQLIGMQRADVVKDPSKSVSNQAAHTLEDALVRLMQHEPIQYITGLAWFGKLALRVSPAVLVPRPETEELVMLASKHIKEEKLTVLDIGTGSGCIPILLLTKNKNISCTAIDISEEALHIAKLNAGLHNSTIHFKQVDFLDESVWSQLPEIDVIISNPPYIPEADKNLLDDNVSRFEPHLALFEPGGQPLIFYYKIAKYGMKYLNEGGKIFVEIHEDFGSAVLQIFIDAGYEANLVKDMFGKERFVEAKKCEPQRH